jgi:translation initiation factor IF-3
LPEALAIARQLDLDLVEVAPGANPPVCRIMDYGKFKFDAAQRAKESRRKAVHVGIKEMKYRPKIGPGDFDTKTRQVAKFLEEGHKVKITIMFRGREVYHPELGKKILDRIAEQMDGMGKSEAVPRLDGRNMVMVLAPDKRAKQSAASKGPGHEANTNGAVSKDHAVATVGEAVQGAAAVDGVVEEPVEGPVGEVATGQEDEGETKDAAAVETGETVETGQSAPASPKAVAPVAAGEQSPPAESSEGEG